MTPRERRLLRLAQLRERQHDVAALHLRAARSNLAMAEAALTVAQQHAHVARLCRLAASMDNDPEKWLLACADVEANTLIAANNQTSLARATAAVQGAAVAEATARRERKQMEATLERVQHEYAGQSARTEQQALDEIARLQHAGRASGASRRRGF